ncbi:hypothetical protein DFH09DRAFT_1105385 [Mycena vulgaris]|nr:hypothetical protein DFH09DRAFT_1105385 [Mycena vulgaris]
MDLSAAPIDVNDPDRPFANAALTKKTPTKKERTGRASIHLATSPNCDRVLSAQYYEDESLEALEYTGRWCCDSKTHPGNTFALDRLFLGPIYIEPVPQPAKRKCNVYRPTGERPELKKLLLQWLNKAHSTFALHCVRSPSIHPRPTGDQITHYFRRDYHWVVESEFRMGRLVGARNIRGDFEV